MTMTTTPDAARAVPLVVDLDGTLTPADTLAESVVHMVRRAPTSLWRLPFWLLKGRAHLKEAVAARSSLDAEHLPYDEAVVAYLREARAAGRRLVLATAAHVSIANRVAAFLGLFDGVIATEGRRNLKGADKLAAIRATVGGEFAYAGDSRADLAVWAHARAAILVGAPADVARRVKESMSVEREFPRARPGPADWIRAFRVHQWAKNVLLFVPLLTSFAFTGLGRLTSCVLAFVAFSLTASATYVANDLWDLESDRVHPRKRLRPFASARIPIASGVGAASVALAAGLALAAAVSPAFLLLMLAYLVLTSLYSWVLKEYVLIDVLMLSLLYTLRIFAGSIAVGIAISSWLLAFSVFVFLSLALVKRCSELVTLDRIGKTVTRGRDYRVSDLTVLWPLGVGAALSAVVVFGLFVAAPETQARYATPELLGLVGVGLLYWLARLWIKTSRQEMHDDPVVYALRDRGSRLVLLAMTAVVLAAHFLDLGRIR
jgi:4-hydroxybenzoate polyprenyltransferase/phosphoserine phosphatase